MIMVNLDGSNIIYTLHFFIIVCIFKNVLRQTLKVKAMILAFQCSKSGSNNSFHFHIWKYPNFVNFPIRASSYPNYVTVEDTAQDGQYFTVVSVQRLPM